MTRCPSDGGTSCAPFSPPRCRGPPSKSPYCCGYSSLIAQSGLSSRSTCQDGAPYHVEFRKYHNHSNRERAGRSLLPHPLTSLLSRCRSFIGC